MVSATIYEAKTQLSDLVKKAQSGEPVMITSGRDQTPVARLEAILPIKKKRPGALETPGFELTDAFDSQCPTTSAALLWKTAFEAAAGHPRYDLATLGPKRLSRRAAANIADERNIRLVSAASAWELATKVRAGRLPGAETRRWTSLACYGSGKRQIKVRADRGRRLLRCVDALRAC